MINRDSLEDYKKRLVEIGYSEDIIIRDLLGLNPDQQVEHLKGIISRSNTLYDWDLSKYPKLRMLNKQAEKWDLTDEKSGETLNFKNGSRITTVPTSNKTVRSKGYYYS